MSRGHVAVIAVIVAIAAWFWVSVWPVALGAAYLALVALSGVRHVAQHSVALWNLVNSSRPLRMFWRFELILTERAWDTLGIPQEQQFELQRLLGEYDSRRKSYLFKDRAIPSWAGLPIVIDYERWGESLERWTIWNGWLTERGGCSSRHEKRTVEFLPQLDENIVVLLGGDRGAHLCHQHGRLIFVNWDDNVSMMPDGRLYIMEGARVLFDIPAPPLDMSHGSHARTGETRGLDHYAAPPTPGVDGFDPAQYHRHHGCERFECEAWDKGFRWELNVHDLRQCLAAKIVGVERTLWRRQVVGLWLELREGGLKLRADPLVVEPAQDGRALPKKGEYVNVVLGNDGEIDRVWLMR